MSDHIQKNSDSKFTKGEKCIFVHIIITFLLIIVLVIIYFIHLIVIDHRGNEAFSISQFHSTDYPLLSYKGVGIVFLNTTPSRSLCNSLLIRERWSVAPGHCVAARSDPDLAYLLPFWIIKYKNYKHQHIESIIIKSIIHPHFSIDDFDNNIGLFEHNPFPAVQQYTLPTTPLDYAALSEATYLEVVRWDLSSHDVNHNVVIKTSAVRPVSIEECRQYASPIVDLRSHEFCVKIRKGSNVTLAHGAIVAANSIAVGFFSWGQRNSHEFPLVILNITFFNDWVDSMF